MGNLTKTDVVIKKGINKISYFSNVQENMLKSAFFISTKLFLNEPTPFG